MSEKPIEVGDLVRVARTCCNMQYLQSGGKIGVVRKIKPYPFGSWYCLGCDASSHELYAEAFNWPHNAAPLSWLKRIDPGSLSEDVPEKEEISA